MGNGTKKPDEAPTYYSNRIDYFASDADICLQFSINRPYKLEDGKIKIVVEPQARVYLSPQHFENLVKMLNEQQTKTKKKKEK